MSTIENEFNINDYLSVLQHRRGAIALFFVSTVIIVLIATFLMPPTYRATATLLIDMESPNVLTTTGLVGVENQYYYSYKEYYQSQTEIITSYNIVRRVFDEFKLADTKEYAKEKEPLEKFMNSIKIEPVRETRLLKLHVDNKNAEIAALIANRIAEIYVKRNLYYISRDELMNLLKNEYLKLQSTLSEYSNIYKEKHPKMVRLEKEIQETTKEIEKVKKVTSELDFLNDNNKGLGLEDGYKHGYHGFKANNISILDYAQTPVVPIKPKKRLNVFFAILVGLFGGTGLAFFFEYLDDTIKNVADLERATNWPFLGSIPHIANSAQTSDKDLLMNKKPKDPIAEAYRVIRTGILFSSTEEHPIKSIVITSPGPQEGKTATVSNLGIALAQSNKRVLLVDADMCRSRLHSIFNSKTDVGLSNFLSGQAQYKELIQKTGIERLFIVSSGPHAPNPSELLFSHKIQEFIKLAEKDFDFVLFDSPPIAIITDANIISRAVDGVIFVVEAGSTSKRVMPRVKQSLENSKARVLGTILNNTSKASGGHNYYYSHYYGH